MRGATGLCNSPKNAADGSPLVFPKILSRKLAIREVGRFGSRGELPTWGVRELTLLNKKSR